MVGSWKKPVISGCMRRPPRLPPSSGSAAAAIKPLARAPRKPLVSPRDRDSRRSAPHALEDRRPPRRARHHPARGAGAGGELRALRASRAAWSTSRARSAATPAARSPASSAPASSVEAGAAAARTCALALIAQLKAACGGDLDRVVRVVKLTGFVNSAPDFTDQPKVVNGASDLFVEVFGDARPARPLGGRRRRRCRSGSRSRSKVSSRSPELPAAFLAAPLAHRGLHDRAARRRSRTAAPPSRRRSPPATASRSTSSARPTARRWSSTTTRCRG